MTTPRMRAGTDDRQAAVDGLTRHFTEGRLNPSEFDERVGTAYAAIYLDELPGLFADLPEAQPHRGTGSIARRPDPYQAVYSHPVAMPSPWTAPPRPSLRRLRILAVLSVLTFALLIGVSTHGLFLFPLVWVTAFLMFGGSSGHSADPSTRDRNRW
jgi:hypothetical protein